MTLKTIFGAFMSVSGILSVLLGILFIIASKGDSGSRLVAGIILLILGLVILIIGVKIFRKAVQHTPAAIKKRLLQLASKNHGQVPEDVIIGELGKSDAVYNQVHELLRDGIASEKIIDNKKILYFPDFLMEMVVKKCPYCGNDYPVRDDVENCPNCGGDLRMQKSRIANSDEKFSIDDEDGSSLS